ncbi:MAG TPA: GNAT family N-acetyltransferase [Clostridia bacterium]|nr:GNAT family N-acetyltransferase [Clostridia bacterium]
MEQTYGKYLISTEKSLLSVDTVYDFLVNKAYWAKYRTKEQIEKSIKNSLCFGVYDAGRQVGFARAVTDYSVMYWLCDVFVDEEYRGQGIGKFLVEFIVNHPDLMHLNGTLCTKDAQGLYQRYGFVVPSPETNTYMAKRRVPLSPA